MAYNTVPIHGKVSRIQDNNVKVTDQISFSIDVSVDTVDITAMGDSWGDVLAGVARWSGSMEYNLTLGDDDGQGLYVDNIVHATTPGAEITDLEFLVDGSAAAASNSGFSGTIMLTSMNISTSIGDAVKGSFSFQGKGAITKSDSL